MENRIILVGGGTMGQSIGRLFAVHGWAVHCVDPSTQARKMFAQHVKGATTSESVDGAGRARLALECVPEDLALKQRVLSDLESCLPDDAPILSNTSGLGLADMSAEMRHPERMMIAHFFNPGDIIPAVEVVPAPSAPVGLCDTVLTILRDLGERPVRLDHAPAGFVANRIQHAIMRECLHLVDEGVASPAAIDEIVQWSVGIRMALYGPFKQRDLNGLGTHHAIATYLYPDLADRHTPSPTLTALVEQGHLGRRTGKGFYDWNTAVPGDEDAALHRIIAIARDAEKGPVR